MGRQRSAARRRLSSLYMNHDSSQDGIERVDASYEVFLRDGFEDFQEYAFELKTTTAQSLAPKRIKEYITVVHMEHGLEMAQAGMEYAVVVLSRYLQMMSAFYIFKEEPDRVRAQFEQFNEHYNKLCQVLPQATINRINMMQKHTEHLPIHSTKN